MKNPKTILRTMKTMIDLYRAVTANSGKNARDGNPEPPIIAVKI